MRCFSLLKNGTSKAIYIAICLFLTASPESSKRLGRQCLAEGERYHASLDDRTG